MTFIPTLRVLDHMRHSLALLGEWTTSRHGTWCLFGCPHPAQVLSLRAHVASRGGLERAVRVTPELLLDVRPLLDPIAEVPALLIHPEPWQLSEAEGSAYLHGLNGYRDTLLRSWGCALLWVMGGSQYAQRMTLATDTWTVRGAELGFPEAGADIEALLSRLTQPVDPFRDEPAAVLAKLEACFSAAIGTADGVQLARAWFALGAASGRALYQSTGGVQRVYCAVSGRLFGPRSPFAGQMERASELDLSLAAMPDAELGELGELLRLWRSGTLKAGAEITFWVPEPHTEHHKLKLAAELLCTLAEAFFPVRAVAKPLPWENAGAPEFAVPEGADLVVGTADRRESTPKFSRALGVGVCADAVGEVDARGLLGEAAPVVRVALTRSPRTPMTPNAPLQAEADLRAHSSAQDLHVFAPSDEVSAIRLGAAIALAVSGTGFPTGLSGAPRIFVYQRGRREPELWGPAGQSAICHKRDPYFESMATGADSSAAQRLRAVLGVSVSRSVLERAEDEARAGGCPLWSLSATLPGQGAMQVEDVAVALREVEAALERISRAAPGATLHLFVAAPPAFCVRLGMLLPRAPMPVVVEDWGLRPSPSQSPAAKP